MIGYSSVRQFNLSSGSETGNKGPGLPAWLPSPDVWICAQSSHHQPLPSLLLDGFGHVCFDFAYHPNAAPPDVYGRWEGRDGVFHQVVEERLA